MPLIPPVYFLAALVATAGLHWWFPGAVILRPTATYLVALVGAGGAAVGSVALLGFARQRTNHHPFDQPTTLVTDGPYHFSRNPMYLALTLALFGVAIRLGTLTPFIVVPAFMLMIQRRFITTEEKRLAELFGSPFAGYRRRVRRWL